MEHSKGKIRADKAHEKLLALGYAGSERTTRRAVAAATAGVQGGAGAGAPAVGDRAGDVAAVRLRGRPGHRRGQDHPVLRVAGLVEVPGGAGDPGQDRAECVRRRWMSRCAAWVGRPTYVLTDNEKTVTIDHVAGIAVRNPAMVASPGTTGSRCTPASRRTRRPRAASESTVKLAKADLVPKDTNLRPVYDSFAELEAACEVFCEQVNTRVHRVTRRAPVDMLAEERARLHPVPATPHTVSFGVTRTVAATTPMVTFEGGQYSVPHPLLGQRVWVRVHGRGEGEQVVIVHVGDGGPVEVARHAPGHPGQPGHDRRALPARPGRSAGRGPRSRAPPRRPSSSPWVTVPGCG